MPLLETEVADLQSLLQIPVNSIVKELNHFLLVLKAVIFHSYFDNCIK